MIAKLEMLEMKECNILDDELYAFYIMNKAIKEFKQETNQCLKVALTVYALLHDINNTCHLHIGYLKLQKCIIPHSWITINNSIIDLRKEEHINMIVI